MHVAVNDLTLSEQLETFWKIESFGTSPNIPKSLSVQDRRTIGMMEKTITKVDGHYQIRLLWKDENVRLPENRAVAEIRLKHFKRRLERNPRLKMKYLAILDD